MPKSKKKKDEKSQIACYTQKKNLKKEESKPKVSIRKKIIRI
jgi:hypothetical protein